MYSWRFPVLSTLRLYRRVGHRCQSALLQTGSLMLQTFRDLVLRPMFPGYGMMLGATSDSARGWLRVPLFGAAQFWLLVSIVDIMVKCHRFRDLRCIPCYTLWCVSVVRWAFLPSALELVFTCGSAILSHGPLYRNTAHFEQFRLLATVSHTEDPGSSHQC